MFSLFYLRPYDGELNTQKDQHLRPNKVAFEIVTIIKVKFSVLLTFLSEV